MKPNIDGLVGAMRGDTLNRIGAKLPAQIFVTGKANDCRRRGVEKLRRNRHKETRMITEAVMSAVMFLSGTYNPALDALTRAERPIRILCSSAILNKPSAPFSLMAFFVTLPSMAKRADVRTPRN